MCVCGRRRINLARAQLSTRAVFGSCTPQISSPRSTIADDAAAPWAESRGQHDRVASQLSWGL